MAELQQREGCSVQGGVGKNEERPSKVKIPLGPEEHACSMSNADALDVERVGTHTQFIHVYRQACDGAPPAPLAAQVAQCRNPWLPAAQGRLLCGHYAPAMHTLGVTAGAPLLAMMLLGACLAHAGRSRRARTRRCEGCAEHGKAARQQPAASRQQDTLPSPPVAGGTRNPGRGAPATVGTDWCRDNRGSL